MLEMSDDWTTYDVAYGGTNKKPPPHKAEKPPSPAPTGSPLTEAARPTQPLTTDTKLLLTGALLLIALVIGGGITLRSTTGGFHQQMIADAVAEYRIVDAGSDSYEKSIRAAVVANAYLTAKDHDNYHKWKNMADEWMRVFNAEIEAETDRQLENNTRRFMRQLGR
jgi:hypothetical protein